MTQLPEDMSDATTPAINGGKQDDIDSDTVDKAPEVKWHKPLYFPYASRPKNKIQTARDQPKSQVQRDLNRILDECKYIKGNSYGNLSEFV